MSENEQWAVFEDENFGKGFTQIPNVITRNPKLSMQAKFMYGLLLSYAWQNSKCFPGQKKMREDTGAKVDTIRKYIYELVDAKILDVKPRGRGKTNVYIFKALTSGQETPQRGACKKPPNGGHKEYSVEEDSDKTSSRKKSPQKITHLDPVIQGCLEVLRDIKYFPRDEPHVAKKIQEYRDKWPNVKPVDVCEDYREYCEDKRKTDPSLLQLRNFFKRRGEDDHNGNGGPRRRDAHNDPSKIRQREIT